MKVEALVDWISATVKLTDISLYPYWLEQMRAWAEKLTLIPRERFLPGKGRYGYEMSLRDKLTGATVLFPHMKRVDMGLHVDMPGQACAEVCGNHLLQELVELDATFSRVDLTLDIHAGGLSIVGLDLEIVNGKASTNAKAHQHIISEKGETLYVGSPTSDKRLRIYDKAAERGIEADWKRVELQTRGEASDACARYIVQEGLIGIPRLIRAFCDFQDPVWKEAMANEPAITLETDKKAPNRHKWLIGRVAKSVAYECLDDPKFWDEFVEAVEAEKSALIKDKGTGISQPMLPW